MMRKPKIHANENAWPMCGAMDGLVAIDTVLGGPPASYRSHLAKTTCERCRAVLKKRAKAARHAARAARGQR